MNSSSAIALTGVNAAMLRMDAAAHNIANAQTPEFRRQQVLQQAQADGGTTARVEQLDQVGVSLESDIVNHLTASYAFVANLRVIQTEQTMLGALLNLQA